MSEQQVIDWSGEPPEKGEIGYCPHCNARMKEYPHTLSKPLARALFKFYRKTGRSSINLKHVDFTRNEWNNFQKLRYFDMVENDPPEPRAGVWRITEKGELWLFAEIAEHKVAVSYRGTRVRYEGPMVTVRDVTDFYFNREWWATNATPREDH